MKTKTIAFRVSEEIYEWFEKINRDDNDVFMSDTFRRIFGLYNRYEPLKLSKYDKAWGSILIMLKGMADLLYALTEKTQSESKRPSQYDWVLSNINTLRTTFDTIQSTASKAEGYQFSRDQEDKIIDTASLLCMVMNETSNDNLLYKRLERVIRDNFKQELRKYTEE